MNWNDTGFLPVHAVAEYVYCPRSAFGLLNGTEAAISGTGSFREGKVMHEIVDFGGEKTQRGWRVERSVRVSSETLGLVGIIDQLRIGNDGTVEIWEYKRGKRRKSIVHEMQVSLLALCYRDSFGVLPSVGVVWTTGDRQSRRFSLYPSFFIHAESLLRDVCVNLRRPASVWPRRRQPGCTGCIYRFSCWTEEELKDIAS